MPTPYYTRLRAQLTDGLRQKGHPSPLQAADTALEVLYPIIDEFAFRHVYLTGLLPNYLLNRYLAFEKNRNVDIPLPSVTKI